MCAAGGHKGCPVARGAAAGRSPFPGRGRAPLAPGPGRDRHPRQNSPAIVVELPRGQGWGCGSYNLLAVKKALSGDDAPARSKRPEQSVNETCFSFRIIDMI